MGSSRGIEKCPQSGWGCMGGGATDHHLEGKDYPVQLYLIFEIEIEIQRSSEKMRKKTYFEFTVPYNLLI
jgi:hypothetical protein